MKHSALILAIFISSMEVKAQTTNAPNAVVVADIEWLATQLELPVPDAEMRLKHGFLKMTKPDARHVKYVSVAKKIVIIIGSDYLGNLSSVECDIYNEELPTIKLAIERLGLYPSGEVSFDGSTVYTGPYNGFLDVRLKATRFIITAKDITGGE